MTVELSKKIKIKGKSVLTILLKKSSKPAHTEYPFFRSSKILSVSLVRDTLNPKSKSKSDNGTRFARVFSKAKTHDSQH